MEMISDMDEKKQKYVEVGDKVEPDSRFILVEEEKKEDKQAPKEDKNKFGGKNHKKSIRRENRLKKYYSFVSKLKGVMPDSAYSILMLSGRLLDYIFNVIIISSIMFSVYIGLVAMYNGDWIRVGCAGLMIVVLSWLDEKII